MIADGIALEQTVLGHALNDSNCFQRFAAQIEFDDFAASNHKVIAYCFKHMYELGIRQPDEDSFQLVSPSFPGDDKEYGGTEYIRKLKAAFVEPTQNYDHFIEKIKLQAVKRRIGSDHIKSLIQLTNDPSSDVVNIRNVINQIDREIDNVSKNGFQFIDAHDLSKAYLKELENRKDRKFSTTGLPSLDEKLSEGFLPKNISVIAGFTGMAKSTVAITMAHRIAVTGTCVAVFTMESTNYSMFDKLVSTLTQIPLIRLKRDAKDLSEDEKRRIAIASEQIGWLPLLMNDQPSISVDGINYQLQAANRMGYEPKVVFIDLFGKVEDVDTGEGNMAAKIQKECKRMRVLGKTLDIHFVLIVQIGRSGFGKQKNNQIKRPTLIDIKNANAYAEEANNVFLLHRNKYYLPDLQDDILEFDIAKQRDGQSNQRVYFDLYVDTSTIVATNKVPYNA